MDAEKRSDIVRLQQRFPALTTSEARLLLEASNWNFTRALAAAEAKEAERKKGGPEKYFVGGGAGGSGQEVLAAPSESQDATNLIENLFTKAKQEQSGEDAAREDVDAFYGKGRRLGHTTNSSPFIAAAVRQQRNVTLAIYANGYTIDDGPLQPSTTPEAKAFFAEMERGFVPATLAAKYPDCDLDVKLRDCQSQTYTPPAYAAFNGAGHRLATAGAAAPAAGGAASFDATRVVTLDEAAADVTNLRIVNTQGQTTQVKVNATRHTVEDVYALAHTVQPDLARFELVVRDVPPRKLDEAVRQKTVEEAKLKRAVLSIKPL
ncbi:UBX domain-containing protein 1 [Strigomonas culicis]|uniref:UBX domain-containing protein 1 n=1 Tax=Strigomonas culicis TaxID=28005 RepID=S9UYH1_9TRYP|nr:UBX domain-containing protein 1 [Strigomonas culicis]|eukprot:EPY33888.1 UBX domain-containing protein 1 [Strigomonas culicis]